MNKPFFITDGMNKIGPFSKEEVLQMLYGSHISLMDYIIDSRDNRMCPLLQHEDFGGDGSVHAMTSSGGIAGLTPKALTNKYGFGELRKSSHREREQKTSEKRRSRPQPESHLKEVIEQKPELNADSTTVIRPTPSPSAPPPTLDTPANPKTTDLEIDEITTTTTLKTNNSLGFYIKVKGQEFGPLKFLILLSLLQQNKINLQTYTRSQSDTEWKYLSDFIPKELQQTIHLSPVINTNILPKTHWKRKNVRVDYEEMVMLNNARYSLVAKSLDISAEGIAVVWVYDIQAGEEFDISIFDIEKNLITIHATLVRRESVVSEINIPLYKAVFIFKQKIPIKNFIG